MIKCKQAMENSACGKDCCCLECEEKETCKDVCSEWENNFQAFYDWSIANGYSDVLTLDRIESDKGYYPENCRWVTYQVQEKNKACVPKYEYDGVIFCQSEVFELFGVKRTTFQARIKRGWSVEEAIGRVVHYG